MKQNYSSKNTSVNKISSIFKVLPQISSPLVILDYGCGKYDTGKTYIEEKGYIWKGYDPFNRTAEENSITMNYVKTNNIDIIVCSDVLNVVEDDVLNDILKKIKELSNKNTSVFFSIYERDGSNVHCVTSKGYQRNEKLETYIPKIKKYFNSVEIYNKTKCIIKATI